MLEQAAVQPEKLSSVTAAMRSLARIALMVSMGEASFSPGSTQQTTPCHVCAFQTEIAAPARWVRCGRARAPGKAQGRSLPAPERTLEYVIFQCKISP